MITEQGEAYINSNLGFFVTLEGLDGSGTTSVVEALGDEFEDAVLTQEPTEMFTGKHVRDCIDEDRTHPLTDFFAFMGDRVHHVESIVKPAIENGNMVISDRYADSSRAYQGTALREHLGQDSEQYIERVMHVYNYQPNLTLWLDESPSTTFERVSGDEKYEEQLDFQKRVYESYNRLYHNTERIHRIDASQSLNEVINDCIEQIDFYYNMHKLQNYE